jgi:dienelactone hydrolase
MEAERAHHSDDVLAYLGRLYDEEVREPACRATAPAEVGEWQAAARPALRRLIGLEAMEASLEGHQPTVDLQRPEDAEGFTRQLGRIETEPNVRIAFWLLKPSGNGPFPLAIMPHGHEASGHDTYAGVAHSEEHRRKRIEGAQADVAVQAAGRGFAAIAPNTRGFGPAGVPDLNGRHGNHDCHSQFIHCLLAGRTAIAERVWDTQRLLDWGLTLPEVDSSRVLMMGNSGGGVCTTYTAACDERVTVAVPSCSFAPYVSRGGRVHHCDCNAIPGILRFGDFHDVAGLIAPRHLLIVNGRKDELFDFEEVERAVAGVRAIYSAAGCPDHFEHRWGPEGHRFYRDLMWPFIERVLAGR